MRVSWLGMFVVELLNWIMLLALKGGKEGAIIITVFER